MVLLALVYANYKLIVVDVGAFGKNSDGSILRNSHLGKANDILPHVIIGDEAFPLSTNLMRPYSRDKAQRNEGKKVFNYRLSRG